MQMAGMQVHAQKTPTGSGDGDAQAVVGKDKPVDALIEEVVGGGDVVSSATTLAATAETQDPDAVATSKPPTKTEGDDGQETTKLERNPLEEGKTKETAAPAQPEMTTETPTTETPVELTPQTPEHAVVVEATTKPSLRTQDPAVISDAVTNDGNKTQAPGYLSQGTNPLVLVALAAMCCVFLLLWGRKRRSSATTSSSISGGAGSKSPKVQYKQVPDEQPFNHSQDDDDEYCDDYEEDTFANDRDNWDDWEGNSTQTQVSLNPFAGPPRAPRPTTPRQSNTSTSPFKLSKPLPPPPPPQQQHHAPHQEIAIASTGDLLPSSVESNSSSESFEVVTEEAHVPPTGSQSIAADEEKETESVDDLFSQFGMVPTFKKSAVVPPAAPVSQPATTETLSSSSSSLPNAAEASALFAVEMDDELTAVDAADEWGEDDEWVKGI